MVEQSDPNFDGLPPEFRSHFDERLKHLPVGRIQRMADFYALRSVEIDHVRHVARQYNMSDAERRSVESWWLHRIQVPLDGKIRDLGDQRHAAFIRQMEKHRLRRHRFKSKFVFQLWFNSIGPGGMTWFGNRYVTIRHYTFRLRWRP